MARILVADDEEQVRVLLKRLLEVHQHTVDTVNDGAEAVDRLQAKAYDLLIIDHHMPRMSGQDAVAVLRSTAKFKDLKILMLTVANVTQEIEEAFEAGINGYIIKPFDMAKLVAKVDKTLGK